MNKKLEDVRPKKGKMKGTLRRLWIIILGLIVSQKSFKSTGRFRDVAKHDYGIHIDILTRLIRLDETCPK